MRTGQRDRRMSRVLRDRRGRAVVEGERAAAALGSLKTGRDPSEIAIGTRISRRRLLLFLCVGAIVTGALADLPHAHGIGSVSGLSLLTIAIGGLGVLAASLLPRWGGGRNGIMRVFNLSFGGLLIYAVLSSLPNPPNRHGWQQWAVMATMFVLVSASAKSVALVPGLMRATERAFGVYVGAAILYIYGVVAYGLSQNQIYSARSIGLALLPAVGHFLARTVCSSGGRRRTAGYVSLVLVVSAVAGSLSRAAMGVILVMVIVSTARPGRRVGRLVPTAVAAVVACIGSVVAVLAIEPLHERFFTGDLSATVLGRGINVMGRVDMWGAVIRSGAEAPWFGRGPGSSSDLMLVQYAGLLELPHNEYLRIWHDFGVAGLSLLLLGVTSLIHHAWRSWQTSRDVQSSFVHLRALLCAIGLALTMLTDNTLVYIFGVAPMAVVWGISFGFLRMGRVTPAGRCKADVLPRDSRLRGGKEPAPDLTGT